MFDTASIASSVIETLSPPEPEFTQDELETFARWCMLSGMRPEGAGGGTFTLEGRRYLAQLYDERRDAPIPRIVNRKAAQLGLTIRMLLRGAWLSSDARRRFNVGFMFPTKEDVQDLHVTRFRPMLRSSGRMMRLVEGNIDRMDVVRIGQSNMRFRGMRTGTGVDSFPADALLFDEVRLMSVAMILRAFLRVSESNLILPGNDGSEKHGVLELNSTAGFPDADIDYFFRRSTQHVWHVFCPNGACSNRHGFVLEEAWPACVDTRNMSYICPKCGTPIEDTQRGEYQRTGPHDAEWIGYSFSKILKGNAYLPEMWSAYESMVIDGKNPPEFFNSFLAMPYQDPDAVIVTEAVFNTATALEPTYRWPEPGVHPEGWFTAMGIDQRATEKHLVILRLGPGRRVYLAHLEIVPGTSDQDAITRCVALAQRWGVDIAVVDAMPSYGFASGLGRALPRKQGWLAFYTQGDRDQPLLWSDQRDNEKLKHAHDEGKYEFVVHLDRYKHLLQAFNLFVNHRVVVPADAMEKRLQEIYKDGKKQTVPLAAELRYHLQNIARTKIPRLRRLAGQEIDTGTYIYVFRNVAVDPHFAHAYGYAVAGLLRRMDNARLERIEHESAVPPPKVGSLHDQLPKSYRPAEHSHSFRRSCDRCRFFQASPKGGLGKCFNKLKAEAFGAEPPLFTSSRATNCKQFRKA